MTATFTARQRQVVLLIARGYSNDEMAAELSVGARTAKAHSDVLRQKLGVAKKRDVPMAYWRATGECPYPTAAEVGARQAAAA